MTNLSHLEAPRRRVLGAGLGLGAALAAPRIARARTTEVPFTEAVHALGYIDLYVAQHAGYFEQQGIHLNLSAAGGDTQTFASVLGRSSMFGMGDPSMVPMSVERGGPGQIVGMVIQRAAYWGVSLHAPRMTSPKQFKGLTLVTSPDPNTNYSLTKKLLTENGLTIDKDFKILQVTPGTEIAAMLAGQADVAIAYEPSVAEAQSHGAKIVFDFPTYMGPFCATGIEVLDETIKSKPKIVQALCNGLELGMRRVYVDLDYAKAVAKLEFPTLSTPIIDQAMETQVKSMVPAQSVVVDRGGWDNLIKMQVYLHNLKGATTFEQIVNNSFAEKATKV